MHGTSEEEKAMIEPGYESLAHVLQLALDQAQSGKGKERHANSLPFHEQPIMYETRLCGLGFPIGQARKKAQETLRLPTPDAMQREILGAINYLAAAYIYISEAKK